MTPCRQVNSAWTIPQRPTTAEVRQHTISRSDQLHFSIIDALVEMIQLIRVES